MELRRRITVQPMWRQAFGFLGIMFFIFLADAAVADFVPGFMQDRLGSPLAMGLTMSCSSIAGFALDLLFARYFRNVRVRLMLLLSILGFGAFVGFLYLASYVPWLVFFLAGMVVWGLYYEFFGFASQKFVVSVAGPSQRTAVWSVLESVRAVAYAIGPLATMQLMVYGERTTLAALAAIAFLSLVMFSVIPLRDGGEDHGEHEPLTVWHELAHWRVLFAHIWPMILLGFVLGLVDAMYWTTGTVVNDQLAARSPIGGLFLTLYMISSLFVGFVMGRMVIREGKKRLAAWLVLASGIVLIGITWHDAVLWYLAVVFTSSLLSALAWPLMDAVYTDLLARMGHEQIHMVGLRNACYSIAFILGPTFAGLLAGLVGELPSFTYMGVLMAGTGLILILFTPRKLRLPQAEIQQWE